MRKQIINTARWIMTAVFIILITTNLISQQVIRFKSGNEYQVKVLYQTKDTVKYEMASSPGIVYTVLMEQVDSVWTGTGTKVTLKDSLNLKIKHYQKVATGGGLLMGLGGVLIIAAVAINPGSTDPSSPDYSENYWGKEALRSLLMAGGVVSALVGIPILIYGSSKSKKCKELKRTLSLDLNCTPKMTGLTLRYKF
jgi:hypothetical protein